MAASSHETGQHRRLLCSTTTLLFSMYAAMSYDGRLYREVLGPLAHIPFLTMVRACLKPALS